MTTKTTDSKGRLSLGKRFANRTAIVEEIDGTEVRITLTRVVPEREMPLHGNRSAAAAVSRGLAEARAGCARRSSNCLSGGKRDRHRLLTQTEPVPLAVAEAPASLTRGVCARSQAEAGPPTGASSCRPMTTATSFTSHPTSCPRSTSTASDRCQTPGHDSAARPPDSERLRADGKKNATPGGKEPAMETTF